MRPSTPMSSVFAAGKSFTSSCPMSGLAAGDLTFVRPSGNRIALRTNARGFWPMPIPSTGTTTASDGKRVPQNRPSPEPVPLAERQQDQQGPGGELERSGEAHRQAGPHGSSPASRAQARGTSGRAPAGRRHRSPSAAPRSGGRPRPGRCATSGAWRMSATSERPGEDDQGETASAGSWRPSAPAARRWR